MDKCEDTSLNTVHTPQIVMSRGELICTEAQASCSSYREEVIEGVADSRAAGEVILGDVVVELLAERVLHPRSRLVAEVGQRHGGGDVNLK